MAEPQGDGVQFVEAWAPRGNNGGRAFLICGADITFLSLAFDLGALSRTDHHCLIVYDSYGHWYDGVPAIDFVKALRQMADWVERGLEKEKHDQ